MRKAFPNEDKDQITNDPLFRSTDDNEKVCESITARGTGSL